MYNETKKACNDRYLAKFEKIWIRVTPEEKKIIEQNAKNAINPDPKKIGKSVNQYLRDLALPGNLDQKESHEN